MYSTQIIKPQRKERLWNTGSSVRAGETVFRCVGRTVSLFYHSVFTYKKSSKLLTHLITEIWASRKHSKQRDVCQRSVIECGAELNEGGLLYGTVAQLSVREKAQKQPSYHSCLYFCINHSILPWNDMNWVQKRETRAAFFHQLCSHCELPPTATWRSTQKNQSAVSSGTRTGGMSVGHCDWFVSLWVAQVAADRRRIHLRGAYRRKDTIPDPLTSSVCVCVAGRCNVMCPVVGATLRLKGYEATRSV